MKTKIYSLFAILTLSVSAWSQGVGINETGANPDASAILDASSTTKGFLPPRMTTSQRNAISNPATGLMVYNTSLACLQVNDGTPASPVWNCISNGAGIPDGSIASLNCAGATNNGTLTEGQAASGVNSVIAYTGGNGGPHSGQVVSSTGVTGLTATLTAGSIANGAGNLTYTITGTPSAGGTASFAINIGGQACTLTRTVAPVGVISTINCAGATNNGTLTEGQAASGVNSVIAYTGGNGGAHSGQVVTSTGVTGLTATLVAGTFANGSGNLTYTITGTPASVGTASFAINIGGQSCTLTRTVAPAGVSNICNPSNPTVIVDVTNPATGKTWMDRNLGANRAATSSTDAESYGSLYQWGRGSDGHQCVNRYAGDGVTTSSNTALNATVSTDTPPHGNFILTNTGNNDWRSPQNNNLWQGVSGTNNPCPTGYRLPTETELENERLSWSSNNATGAFGSPLKFPMAGLRNRSIGTLSFVGSDGFYWSSTVSSTLARYLSFGSSTASMNTLGRAVGFSVRCLKD